MVDVAGLCTAPIRVDELVEKLAPGLARGRDPDHPEVPVWSGKLTWNNRREIRSQGIINHRSLDQLIALHVNHKSRGLALAYIREQVRHYLVLVIDGMVEFQDVNHQPALFLIAVDEVQTVAMAERNFRHLFASPTRHDQQKAASLWLPPERIHPRAAVAGPRFHVQDKRTEIENDVMLTQAEVMN